MVEIYSASQPWEQSGAERHRGKAGVDRHPAEASNKGEVGHCHAPLLQQCWLQKCRLVQGVVPCTSLNSLQLSLLANTLPNLSIACRVALYTAQEKTKYHRPGWRPPGESLSMATAPQHTTLRLNPHMSHRLRDCPAL